MSHDASGPYGCPDPRKGPNGPPDPQAGGEHTPDEQKLHGPVRGPEEELALLGKILSHPLRIRILIALADEGEWSATRLANQLREPVGKISYHVRYLADSSVVELQRIVPRRGSVESYYSLSRRFLRLVPAAARLLPGPESQQP